MDIVLIHGMGRTPFSMLRLRRQLRRAGHTPILFGYSPTFESLQGATARLVRLIERRVDSDAYALAGHSLGAVLIRASLGRLQRRPPAACFFLSPPMRVCKAARFFSRFWVYKILTGEMGQLLANDAFMQQLPMPPAFTRIYAGTRGPRARWLPLGTEPNDLILSVSEATGDYPQFAVEVPAIHAFIMHSKLVYDDMIRSLERLGEPTRSDPHPLQE